MARSDLLLSLVKSGASGDQTMFRRTVEAIVAEERAKNHGVLADRLEAQLKRNGQPAGNGQPIIASPVAHDLFYETTPERTLDDLVLPEQVRDACLELVEEFHRADLLRSHNLIPRHRVLLAGPPGNGKTSLAEGLSDALMVPLVGVRYDGLIASYLGETAARLRKVFDYVRTRRCVLFFDEFDTLGKERGDRHETGEIKRVVSSLLLQIDSLPSHVVVVTATNHPELLDRAVWRRFQLRLELPVPTEAQVQEYLRRAESRTGISFSMSPKTLADKLRGLSFAELEEFTADVFRRYVLALPAANVKDIVARRLKQWQHRFTASPSD
jgi:SpoVK/Ycf46/Vps4 family AAA+-type ATPase